MSAAQATPKKIESAAQKRWRRRYFAQRDAAARSAERKRAAEERRRDLEERTRFYISFNCQGSWLGGARFRRYAWPILFKDETTAKLVIDTFPVFANSGEIPGRGRIVSACVEKVVLQ